MGKEEKLKEIKSKIIPRETLERQIKDTIETYRHAEAIMAEAIRLEGRCGLAHRSLRDLTYFMSEVIFNDEEYVEYSNFKYDPDNLGDEEAVLRWCALYLIDAKRSMI